MNWVGGARSRIKRQEERKKQQEFFAKMRQKFQTHGKLVTTEASKPLVNKDLLFFQTIDRCLSQKPSTAPRGHLKGAAIESTFRQATLPNLESNHHSSSNTRPCNSKKRDGEPSDTYSMAHLNKQNQAFHSDPDVSSIFSMDSPNKVIRKRHSSSNFIPEDFQEFDGTPKTYPLDKFCHRMDPLSKRPLFDFCRHDTGYSPQLVDSLKHQLKDKFVTQEALLFSERPTSHNKPAAASIPPPDFRYGNGDWNQRRNPSQPKINRDVEFSPRYALEEQDLFEVQAPTSADRSIRNYIFYDSTEESPRETTGTKKIVTAASECHTNFRHHTTWAEPLKPKWLQAIGRSSFPIATIDPRVEGLACTSMAKTAAFDSRIYGTTRILHLKNMFDFDHNCRTGSRPEYFHGKQNSENRQTLEFKSRLFSWSHEEVTTRIETQSAASYPFGDTAPESPKHSTSLVTRTEMRNVDGSQSLHYSSDPPSTNNIKSATSDLHEVKNVTPNVSPVLGLKTVTFQDWLMKDIRQQLCYVQPNSTISIEEPADSSQNSIYELCSSNEESLFEVVEVCDAGTEMQTITYQDQIIGTDYKELLDVEVQASTFVETKSVQTEESFPTERVSTKEFKSCAVQTDDIPSPSLNAEGQTANENYA